MSARKRASKPAIKKSAKHARPDADVFRAHQEDRVSARRKLCSMLRFWMVCGHTKCLRSRACALASNDCFDRFWPLVPEQAKICIRAGIEASAGGRSEVAAAITRALARWRETQAPPEASGSAPQTVEIAPAPVRRIAPPVRAFPRVRVL